MKQALQIGNRECVLYQMPETSQPQQPPKALMIQPMGAQERDGIDIEVDAICALVEVPFAMAAFAIDNWEMELTPWHDPAVSNRQEVGEHAIDTLGYITDSLIPSLKERYGELPVVLGGYSLGGLFARWAVSWTDRFEAAASVSPSLWICHWRGFSEARPVYAKHVYISLGDREEHSRNRAMATVGDNVRWEHEHLEQLLGPQHTMLEWNRGGHFADVPQRTAKGFAWCLKQVAEGR